MPFQNPMHSAICNSSRTVRRKSQLCSNLVRKRFLTVRVELKLENQREAAFLANQIDVAFRCEPQDEEWSQSQKPAHLQFDFQFAFLYVTQRVLNLYSVRHTIALESSVKVMFRFLPFHPTVGTNFPAQRHEPARWQRRVKHRLALCSQRRRKSRIREPIDQLHNFVCFSLPVAVRIRPVKRDEAACCFTARKQRQGVCNNLSFLHQLCERPDCNPMEVLVLENHLQLPLVENRFRLLSKKLCQFSFRFINETIALLFKNYLRFF